MVWQRQKAVNGVAFATFVASGQTCIMGARVLVHEDVYDKFMSALVEKVSKLFFLILGGSVMMICFALLTGSCATFFVFLSTQSIFFFYLRCHLKDKAHSTWRPI